MIRLDQKAEILMKYFRDNMSQRAISKEMKVSRTTVRKYIRNYEAKLEVIDDLTRCGVGHNSLALNLASEMVSEPKYDTSNRTRVKLTDEIIEKIEELLRVNERNRLLGRSKQLMKKIDIHEMLVKQGFDISYPTVCNYIRDNYDKKEAFIRQEYDLGESYFSK